MCILSPTYLWGKRVKSGRGGQFREEYVYIFFYIWTAEDLSKTGIWR